MNLKKLFSTGLLLALFFITGVVNAQVGTYYVNNQTGDDANAGTLASPKKSVASALVAAPSGSTISVAPTGVNYIEGNITVSGKTYTFTTTTAGTPLFSAAAFNVGSVAAVVTGAGSITVANPAVVTSAGHGLVTGDVVYIYGTTMVNGSAVALDNQYYTVTVLTANTFSINYNSTGAGAAAAGSAYRTRGTVTFTGTFQFNGGLNLYAGTLANGNNVTVGTGVYRTELGSITAGQLAYTGAIPFAYENVAAGAAVNITTGLEFPVATNIATTLTTTATSGNLTLVLDQNRTINGLMLLGQGANAGGANLGGFTLNLVSGAGALNHFTDGDITNGTLAFTLGAGAISIDGNSASALPNVTASKAAAGLVVLTINPGGASTISTVGSITANTNASVTANNTGDIGAVTLNGAGTIQTINGTGTVGAVLGALGSTGTITLNRTAAGLQTSTSITQTGTGFINFGGNATSITTGAVLLNSAFTIPAATLGFLAGPLGTITFPDVPTTTGAVTNNASINLNGNDNGGNTTYGNINFGAADRLVTHGAVLNGSSTSGAFIAGGALTAFGNINFAWTGTTGGNNFTSGAITNQTQVSGVAAITNSGNIQFTGVTAGANTITTGAILNSSLTGTASASVGLIGFGATGAAVPTVASVTQGNVTGTGGDIQFGIGNFTCTGNMLSNRTAAGADILFGAATGGVTFNVGGNLTNSGASSILVTVTSTGAVTVTGKVENTGSSNIAWANATTATFGFGGITSNTNTDAAGAVITIAGTGTITSGFAQATSFQRGNINLATGIVASAIGGITAANPASVTVVAHGWATGNVVFITGTGNAGIDNKSWTITNTGVNTFTIPYNNAAVVGAVGTAALTRNLDISSADVTIGGTTTNTTFTSPLGNMRFLEAIPNVTQVIKVGGADPAYPGGFNVVNGGNIPAPVVRFIPLTAGIPGNLYIFNNLLFNTALVNNAITLDDVRLNVGKNGVAGGDGHFQNTTGYTTLNTGRVIMSGNAASPIQVVNYTAAAAGVRFGTFGVDNQRPLDGAADVVFSTACVFNQDFLLAKGDVSNVNVTFNGTAPWPTIFRTEGAFIGFPTITAATWINVTYFGGDKTTSFEVPAAGFLNNLTVATTNGAVPGQGVVSLGAATQVDGTLTINVGQNLYTAANALGLNGASAVINGNLVDNGATQVTLMRAGGTVFSATGAFGSLPSLNVANGSNGNSLSGIPGLVSQAFGADNVLGTADDAFTPYDGNITFAAGADAGSSFSVAFTVPAGGAANFANLTMNGAVQTQTFQLGANARMSGNITEAAGVIDLQGFTLTHNGTAPGMTGGATIIGTGTLLFNTGATTFTVTAPAATIAANVSFTGATANLATTNLTINGNFVLGTSAPTTTAFTINAGLTLTLGGPNVTFFGGSSTTATTGILNLVNTAPNTLLTWNVPTAAAPTVANLNVGGNVTLTGGAALASLTVNGAGVGFTGFVMNAGATNTFTFGSANLIIGGGAVATPFVYTSGLFAGAGYLDWNSTGTWTMNAPMAIGNLQVDRPVDITNANANLIANTLTVNSNLYLNGAGGALTGVLTQTRTVAPLGSMLNIAALAQIRVDGTGNIDIAAGQAVPIFAGLVDYLFRGASSAPNAFTWPLAQGRNVTVNMAAAGNTVTPTTSRTISGNFTEIAGQFVVPTTLTFTLSTVGAVITVDNNGGTAAIALTGPAPVGILSAADVNLVYTDVAGGGGAYNSGPEYSSPTIVRNITLGPGPAASTTYVTLVASRTIAGTLSMFSTLDFGAGTTTNWTLAQTIPAGSTSNVIATAIVNWNAGLAVNGTYTNGGTTAVSGGSLTGTGAITNNNIFNLVGMNLTGASNLALGVGSVTTLTGNATIAGFTAPAFIAGLPAEVAAKISTNSNLTFNTGAWTGAGNLVDLVFTGTNVQTLGLGQNRQINNLTMNKGGDQTVTVSGGNLTLNPVQDVVAGVVRQPAGVLTLTRGVIVMTDPTLLTLQITVTGGFITNLGYVRNPANNTDLAHVIGRLGVAIPVNTLGRSEWPVGSTNRYRPAAITFTAGNATIAPTTIIVSHVDSQPITPAEIAAGNRPEFPLDGGTKVMGGANPIGAATPYYWLFEATTSLGAAQLMNVELNGTDVPVVFPNIGNRNHNDLRIMKRFDGNVAVNRYNIEGSNGLYTNALYENTPVTGQFLAVVRNVGSSGSAISQRAIFTIGLPSQAPIWTSTNAATAAMNEATGTTLNTYTSTPAYAATDPDVAGSAITYSYSVTPALPTGATAAITSGGVFTFTPGWNGGTNAGTLYTFTITATKTDGTFASRNLAVTVTNTNRPPDFTATGNAKLPATQSITNTSTALTDISYVAPDPDGEAVTYALTPITPAFAGTVTFNNVAGVGKLNFTPVFADAGKTFTITVTGTDINGGTSVTTSLVTVTYAQLKGDADLDGTVLALDASKILQFVVGLYTPTNLPVWNYVSDVNMGGVGDGTVGAIDAAAILYFKTQVPNAWPTLWKSVPVAGDVAFGQMNNEKGNYTLPINLTNTSGVRSAYIELDLGSSVEFKNVTPTLPEGWISASNFTNGKLRIAMSGVNPLANGSIAFVNVTLKDKEAVANIQGSASLNDQVNSQLTVKVKEIPTEYALSQNYPNPFNPTTNIKYSLVDNAKVSLTIYNMLGQRIKTLVDMDQEAGYYTIRWDGTNELGSRVSSGIYIYRLTAGSFISTMKMNLLK